MATNKQEVIMSLLASLNIVSSNVTDLRTRGIITMRQKLIDRIGDQIALAQAIDAGRAYQRVKFRRVRDEASDEVTETPVRSRVRPWWLQDKDGSILVWIKYGNQTLELAKGKTAIRVKDQQELVKTFETVRDAVRAGEFDTHITNAVGTFKTRFRK